MKIHLLVHTAGTSGGTERITWGWSAWRADRGHEVHLWALRGERAPPGVILRRPPGLAPRGRPWRIHRTGGLIEAIDEPGHKVAMVRARGADLWRAGGGCHAAWLAASGRRGLAERMELAADRAAAETAGRIVANSHLGKQGLVAHSGIDPDKIVLVRNGVDLDRFRPRRSGAPAPFSGPWVAFLGNGYARKNLLAALRALRRVPRLGLLVLGEDPRPQRWAAHAAALGVADRVCFRGPVAAPEEHLVGARALLLPTRYDPSANATLEAMACGVPPVCSAMDGAAELAPEPWMVVADPHDDEALAMTLQRTLDCPDLPDRVRAVAEDWPQARCFAGLSAVLFGEAVA